LRVHHMKEEDRREESPEGQRSNVLLPCLHWLGWVLGSALLLQCQLIGAWILQKDTPVNPVCLTLLGLHWTPVTFSEIK
jgi:hypothetical protein